MECLSKSQTGQFGFAIFQFAPGFSEEKKDSFNSQHFSEKRCYTLEIEHGYLPKMMGLVKDIAGFKYGHFEDPCTFEGGIDVAESLD